MVADMEPYHSRKALKLKQEFLQRRPRQTIDMLQARRCMSDQNVRKPFRDFGSKERRVCVSELVDLRTDGVTHSGMAMTKARYCCPA